MTDKEALTELARQEKRFVTADEVEKVYEADASLARRDIQAEVDEAV